MVLLLVDQGIELMILKVQIIQIVKAKKIFLDMIIQMIYIIKILTINQNIIQ